MILFLVFAFGVLALSMAGVGMMLDLAGSAKDNSRVVAEQMMIYHTAAARSCVDGCTTGPIDSRVRDELPSTRQGQGVFEDGAFRSVFVQLPAGERYVVTSIDGSVRGSGLGAIGAALREWDQQDRGFWRASVNDQGALEVQGEGYWGRQVSQGVVSISKVLSPTDGSLSLSRGSPALISRVSGR